MELTGFVSASGRVQAEKLTHYGIYIWRCVARNWLMQWGVLGARPRCAGQATRNGDPEL